MNNKASKKDEYLVYNTGDCESWVKPIHVGAIVSEDMIYLINAINNGLKKELKALVKYVKVDEKCGNYHRAWRAVMKHKEGVA